MNIFLIILGIIGYLMLCVLLIKCLVGSFKAEPDEMLDTTCPLP